MSIRTPLISALVSGMALWGGCVSTPGNQELLPSEVHGWKPTEPDGIYDADSLFEYINGAAEVYRAYGVVNATGRHYRRSGHPDIITDVFLMASPADAYGVYHHDNREGADAGVGAESEYFSGTLSFWKGSHFICILPFDETPDTEKAVRAIASHVDRLLPAKGNPPELLRQLPPEGLLKHSMRYFHTHEILNAYYYLADDNILELSPKTKGVLGRYVSPDGKPGPFLVIIQYPAENLASSAHQAFLAAYVPDADADGLARIENSLWSGIMRHHSILAIVLDAPSREDAMARLKSIRTRS